MTPADEPPRAEAEPPAKPPIVVKKYANRRLYNTESSSYITLDNLAEMVRVGRDFTVFDARTGEDITRSVLTQIIVEEESKGRALLPTPFLRQLIGLYGDSLQAVVPKYLEQAMTSFAHQQQQMRSAMRQTMGGFFPFDMEDLGRQNLAMMERAMGLFAPFYKPTGSGPGAATATGGDSASRGLDEAVAALHQEIARLHEELREARQAIADSKSRP